MGRTSAIARARAERIARLACLATTALLGACGAQPSHETKANGTSPNLVRDSADGDALVSDNVARIRAATAAFKSLDAAVAAGYARDGGRCLDHPPHGAMGYHHVNQALLDDALQIEKPEMLVYERMPDSTYQLNGVEYIVPFSEWAETREPPVIMGQALKPSASLKIWYRHVWVWRENPSGLFADWNPVVKCGA